MSDFAGADIQGFLDRAGWKDATVTPLPGDASTRRYARIRKDGRTLMLMHQPQGAETATAPADASPAMRQALGYNAIARLAGADTGRFAAVADYLRGRGLAAPRVHAADFPRGLVLLEDLGDALFADVLKDGGSEEEPAGEGRQQDVGRLAVSRRLLLSPHAAIAATSAGITTSPTAPDFSALSASVTCRWIATSSSNEKFPACCR